MAKVIITYTAHLPSPRPDRLGQLDTLIQYSVDGNAAENVIIPDPDPTPAAVQLAITQQITANKVMRNTTFDVD
jgi:hypothetical protein